MSLFTWKSEYSIGSAEIDTQHKKLFRIADDLHGAMCVGAGGDTVPRLLNELIRYTCQHFANEERIMRESGYPDYAMHRLEHENLTRQVLHFQKEAAAKNAVVTLEVMEFLSDWLRHHIKGADQKIAGYLKARSTALR